MIVVDASVVVDAIGDDGPDGASARRAMRNHRLFAPDFFDLEALNAWRRQTHAGNMTPEKAANAIRDLRQLDIAVAPHRTALRRIWELREYLTVFDAAYVALAESLGAPLLTKDKAISRAPGVRCEVLLLERE